MARIQPAQPEADEPGRGPGRRRRAARYAVPVAVAGVAVATISLVPALADAGDPSLPSITARQLLTKIAGSDTQTVDGSVKVTADLGLPSALSGGGSLFGSAAPSGVPGLSSGGSPAAPQTQLSQLLIGSHQLHVAADGPDRQKVSLIEPAAEYSVIHNGNQLWAYDSKSDQAYHQTLPRRSAAEHAQPRPQDFPATPQAAAQEALKAADGTASITVDGTARVAGHSAYQLLITPQHADTTTVGSIRIAVDARTGVPLRFTLSPKGGGKAVFDIGFTKVSFAEPAASTFAFTPGKGVKVTQGGTNDKAESGHDTGSAKAAPEVIGKGWDSIAVIRTGSGLPSGAAKSPTSKSFPAKGGQDSGAESMLNSFGSKVSGSYGTGTLFHTRLVNALLTDDGTLYIGAVTESALTDAANAAK
jgi:outer membrane lipoprotein-sorting protein